MTKSQNVRRRLGFTLLEIMTSVTLALMLMYAVARIFSRVGGAMNETSSTMEMTNALRNAKNRLTLDLESLSTTPAPPRNSRNGEGYLCYVEGLGAPFARVAAANAPFSVGDIALDSERFQAKPNSNDNYDYCDNTVGDLDDILSFTAKAPDGQPFRGRYIEPVYEADVNGNSVIVDGVESTFESQYAEIVWFVRGTTLYRRVLPIMSDKALQDSFYALQCASNGAGSLAGVAYKNVMQGFGFYRFYDVSVHLGPSKTNSDGSVAPSCLVANTLGDLTNRANRYFYWNPCGLQLHPDNSALIPPYALNIHGDRGGWYWLRMATLQESAAPNFRAGAPFGQNSIARDAQTGGAGSVATSRRLRNAVGGLSYGTDVATNYWQGTGQGLTLQVEDGETRLNGGSYDGVALPLSLGTDGARFPFLDYWNAPNPWDEVNFETGDLAITASDFSSNSDNSDLLFNQDVILTNVISFNVKAWDPKVSAYVDLGSGVPSGDSDRCDSNDLRSYGHYGALTQNLLLPCVYDTWTEQYQRELYMYEDYCANNNVVPQMNSDGGALADIESEGTISASQLKDYPPPYNTRLKSLQIEIRVFDPRSKNIRNATFDVDLSSL